MVMAVMLGGALGALSRYGVGLWWKAISAQSNVAFFPLATLLVNILGSFLLALVLSTSLDLNPRVKTAITTGFLGSLTTFSTFETDLDTLFVDGRWFWASLYLLANLMLGLVAVQLGKSTASRWF